MGKKSRFLAVKKRNKGRRKKVGVALTLIVVTIVMMITAPAMFFSKEETGREQIDGFNTVSYDLPTDGSLPVDHTGLENIGYMARRLSQQTDWYSEMHGLVDTMIQQRVETYKQFSDGILVSADISASSMIKTAKQLCYVGDFVLWRTAVDAAKADGLNTAWKDEEPTKIGVDDFKNRFGLPATEFSVYIINEETLIGADDVIDNGDGTYSQTFHLNPATDKAPYYYCQQMKQTGGLDDWPVFEYIDVTYTFDGTWQVLRSEISEKYRVKMVVSVGCMASYVTTYEYNTDRAKHTDYNDYFSHYADKPVSQLPEEDTVNAVKCLTQAFGSVLTGPATFALDLDLNGSKIDGAVFIDITNMDVRARLGNIYIWYIDNAIYLEYGGVKARMRVEDLLVLLSGALPDGMADLGTGLDTDALVSQLGEGEFVVGDGSAELRAVLELFGMTLPIDFKFNLDENNQATLDVVQANVTFGDYALKAGLSFGTEELIALSGEEKEKFIDFVPYLNTLVELLTNDTLKVDLSYAQDSLFVDADLNISLKEMKVAGDVSVRVGETSKTIEFSYSDGIVYLNLDGIKVSAGIQDAVELIGKYITLPELNDITLDFDLAKILEQVLSPEFAANFSVSETDGQLDIALKGTELLRALGLDFKLGDVVLSVGTDGITADALGMQIGLSKGTAFETDTDGYVDIVKYAEELADIFASENLQVDIVYESDGIGIAGNVKINTKTLNVVAEIVLTYQSGIKTVNIGFDGSAVYAEIDGIKVKGAIADILALVKEYIDLSDTNISADLLIDRIFAVDFGELVALKETENALVIALKGTELLQAFGFDFALGDVVLTVGDGVTVNMLGATAAIKKAEPFEFDANGYVDIVKYIQPLIDLFKSDALLVEIKYSAGELTVQGEFKIAISAFALNGIVIEGDIDLTYGNLFKTLHVAYSESELYLSLDGVKVHAGVEDIIGLIKEFVAIPRGDIAANQLIDKVFNLHLGSIVKLIENGDSLNVVLKGTELLNAFGIEFDLGDISVNITNFQIVVGALGMQVAVSSAQSFTVNTDGYVDIAPVLNEIISIVRAQAVSFRGTVDFVVPDSVTGEEKTYFNLDIKRGAISWENANDKLQLSVFLDATFNIAGTQNDICFEYANGTVSFAYGNVGAKVRTSEFGTIKDAFTAVYNRVRAAVGKITDGNNPVPDIQPYLEKFDEILTLLKGGNALASAGDNFGGLVAAIGNLVLGAGKSENGICTLGYGDFILELVDATSEGNGLSAILSYADSKFKVLGDASIKALVGEKPTMPVGEYLTADELCELLDYVATAVETATEQSLTLDLSGSVSTNDTETYPNGKKYDFDVTLGYYSGATFPVHLDTENKNLWLNTDMYLHAEVNLVAQRAEDTSLWIDAYLLDLDEKGETDGELDLWVSVSTFAKDSEGSAPLKLYAPASELMTILSAALPLIGLDSEILRQFLIEKWLDVTTVEQLRAIGNSLSISLGFGNILSSIGAVGGEEEGIVSASATRNGLFETASISDGENEGERVLRVAFNSEMLYGNKHLSPLSVSVTKALYRQTTADENGIETVSTRSYISGLALNNVWLSKEGKEKLDLDLAVSLENPKTNPEFTADYNLGKMGITDLLKAFAVSATHKVTQTDDAGNIIEKYEINDSFYIGGSATMSLKLPVVGTYNVPVKKIALKIILGTDGEIEANVLLEFDQFSALGIDVFKGNTRVDLSLKKGMAYVKRTQTSGIGESGKAVSEKDPEILYRAMPLKTLANDMIGQMKFLFNFSDTVSGIIEKAINGSGSTGGGESEKLDIGAMLNAYLSSYRFTPATQTENKKWDITLNGAAISGNILKDINITVDVDKNDNINRLSLGTEISAGTADNMIDIGITGNLKFMNPQNKPVKDETVSVSTLLIGAMNKKIEIAEADGWKETAYIGGQCAVVRYYLSDTLLASQDVVFDPATGELFAKLEYPDLSNIHEDGYTLTWSELGADEKFTGDRDFYVVYSPNTYAITFKSEFPFDGVYTQTVQYVYGDREFVIPTERNETRVLSCFTDAQGNIYRTASDFKRIHSDTVLNAVWDWVDYKIIFVYKDKYGEQIIAGEQNAHYGDAIVYPEVLREGYRLAGWNLVTGSSDGRIVSANATFEAVFTAIEYTVTLSSEYPIDGFVFDATKNAYVKSVRYTFDSNAALPSAIRYTAADGFEYFLDGFIMNGSDNIFVAIPGLDLTGKTLFAKWSEAGYAVTYEVDGVEILTQNYTGESALSLPEIPYRKGHTGEWGKIVDGGWQKVTEGEIISEPTLITARYTPNTYNVTLCSDQPIDGYDLIDGVYRKSCSYVYGTILTLPEEKISRFNFIGYYTEENGQGQKVETIQDIIGDKTLYLYFVSNGVQVTLKSDVGYDGAIKHAGIYEQTVTLYDDYTLSDAPKTSGYQQIGWWYHDSVDGWTRVTDIRNYDGKELWALWISQIDIKITTFTQKKIVGIHYTTFGGTVTGGEPVGENGKAIYALLNVTKNYQGAYTIFSNRCTAENIEYDNLKYNKVIEITDGKFYDKDMTSSKAGLYWDSVPFGGIALTATYSYSGGSIKLQDVCYVSHATYRAEILDENGKYMEEYLMRQNFPYVKEFISLKQQSGELMEIDLNQIENKLVTFADYAPELQEKEGYTVAWSGVDMFAPITGDVKAQITYTPNVYPVTLLSDAPIDGWVQDEKGRYILVTEMNFGSKVNVTLGGNIISSYTVGIENNVFEIPATPEDAELTVLLGKNGAEFIMKYNYDTVVYHSGINFTIGDYTGNRYSDQYNDGAEDFTEYALPIPSAENYIFLGWYRQTENGYEHVVSLGRTQSVDTTEVYALWAQEAQTRLTTAQLNKSGFIVYSYKWYFAGSATGGEYSADEYSSAIIESLGASVSANVTYYAASDSTGTGETTLYTTTANNVVNASDPEYAGTYANGFDGNKSQQDLKYCRAVLTYVYLIAGEQVAVEVSSEYIQRA